MTTSPAPIRELAPARAAAPSATDSAHPREDQHPFEGHELSFFGVITVLIASLLAIIDFFIVNVALPQIDHSLHASTAILELVVAGYGISYSLLLVLGGRLGDVLGRRRLFLGGMAAFGITSLLCGLAPSAGLLVAARIAQGASAAAMVPQVLATIQASTQGQRRARAIAMYGACGGVASVAGQLLGGVLISANIAGTGWRPIFLVNVPIVIVGLILAARVVPETRSAHPSRPDILGTVLLSIAVLTLLIPLMEGRSLGWPLWTWVMLAVFPISAVAFGFVERRRERAGHLPFVPPSLVRTPSMRSGLLVVIPFFTGFGGFMFIYAIMLQKGLHFSALSAGLALTPLGITFFVASLLSPRLANRFGRNVIGAGAVLQGVGLGGLIITVLTMWPHLTPLNMALSMAIIGFGQGMVMSPLFRIVLSHVPATRAGVGSGVLVTTQQSSLALGVATLGSLFLSLSGSHTIGMRQAFAIVVGVQISLAVMVIVVSRMLSADND